VAKPASDQADDDQGRAGFADVIATACQHRTDLLARLHGHGRRAAEVAGLLCRDGGSLELSR
jgi:hypothetical protein